MLKFSINSRNSLILFSFDVVHNLSVLRKIIQQLPFILGFDTMTPEEQAKVRNLFSEANHQTHQAGLHERAMRRFTIMREASRLMAESRNLQLAADQEGIPLNVPFFQGAWQRHQISRPDKNTNEIANAIVGLISDIANSEDGRKRGGKKRLTKPLKE